LTQQGASFEAKLINLKMAIEQILNTERGDSHLKSIMSCSLIKKKAIKVQDIAKKYKTPLKMSNE